MTLALVEQRNVRILSHSVSHVGYCILCNEAYSLCIPTSVTVSVAKMVSLL
jgi:hypothetical protein